MLVLDLLAIHADKMQVQTALIYPRSQRHRPGRGTTVRG
jgi:hypothetical protein